MQKQVPDKRRISNKTTLTRPTGYLFSAMVGTARCAVPARVVAGGTNIRATLAFEEVAPLHAARTLQRDVPTTLDTYPDPAPQIYEALNNTNRELASCPFGQFVSTALRCFPANSICVHPRPSAVESQLIRRLALPFSFARRGDDSIAIWHD